MLQWYAPDIFSWASIAAQYCFFSDGDSTFLIEIYFIIIVHGYVPASANLLPPSKVVSSVGAMSTLFAGALMLRFSLTTVVAGAVPPVGSPNTFVEISLVDANGSVGFPAVEMVPVSLIADRMVPSVIPCISSAFERPFSRRLFFWCAFSQGRRLALILIALLWHHALPSVYRCVVGRLKVTVFLLLWFLLAWYGIGLQLGCAAGSNN